MSDLPNRLRAACNGQPATIPWPHRLLHEAADEIERAHLFKPAAGEDVYVFSMGKRLRLTAIATTDEAANRHCEKTDDAVIACFGPLVLMANKYDNGTR